jgi:DNA-directed RNA polymerase specialized sigma subunit
MTTEYLNNKVFEAIIHRFQRTKKEKAKYELIIEDLQDMMQRKGKRNACTEKDKQLLDQNLIVHFSIAQEHDTSKTELAMAFHTLSENIVRYAKFNLIDAADAIQEGVMICFEKVERFDPNKGKAFNYMTTCVINNLRQQYRTARNYNELKRKYLRHLQSLENQLVIKNGKEMQIFRSHIV